MTFLLYDDTLRSLELRHEVGELMVDPIAFIEHDGARIVVAGPLEEDILKERPDVDEFLNTWDFGHRDLLDNRDFPEALIGAEIVLRVLEKLGIGAVVVPGTFRTNVADHLRAGGVEVLVDDEAWSERRRRKTSWEREDGEDAMHLDELKFDNEGLVPVIVQEAHTKDILMLAYADAEAVKRTLDTKTTWFWSRSRRQYWNKGATSGHVQKVVEVRYDCDADALLVLVEAEGPACHTGERSCFYRALD